MFAIIKFLINDTIEIAATNWIKTPTYCFWPPKTHDVAFHIRKRTEPSEDWDCFEIKIEKVASTYNEARKKLVEFSKTSDSDAPLTTDSENYGRGKRNPCPRKMSSDEEEEEEEENSPSLLANSLPTLPQKNKTKSLSTKRKKNTSDKILSSTNSLVFTGMEDYEFSQQHHPIIEHISNQPTDPHVVHTTPLTLHSSTHIFPTPTASHPPTPSHISPPPTPSHISHPPAPSRISLTPAPSHISLTPAPSHIALTPTTTRSLRTPTASRVSPYTPINSVNPHVFQAIENLLLSRPDAESSDSNILHRVFREMYLLKEELSRQGHVLNKILEKMGSQTAPPERKLQHELSVPFNTIEEVEEFDNSLSDIEVKNDLMMKLTRFGGSMYPDHALRIMKYFFTDSLAENYNWMGNNGKRRFTSLKLCNIIIDAVLKENNITGIKVEDALKTWLRHAKERRCYIKKSKNVH